MYVNVQLQDVASAARIRDGRSYAVECLDAQPPPELYYLGQGQSGFPPLPATSDPPEQYMKVEGPIILEGIVRKGTRVSSKRGGNRGEHNAPTGEQPGSHVASTGNGPSLQNRFDKFREEMEDLYSSYSSYSIGIFEKKQEEALLGKHEPDLPVSVKEVPWNKVRAHKHKSTKKKTISRDSSDVALPAVHKLPDDVAGSVDCKASKTPPTGRISTPSSPATKAPVQPPTDGALHEKLAALGFSTQDIVHLRSRLDANKPGHNAKDAVIGGSATDQVEDAMGGEDSANADSCMNGGFENADESTVATTTMTTTTATTTTTAAATNEEKPQPPFPINPLPTEDAKRNPDAVSYDIRERNTPSPLPTQPEQTSTFVQKPLPQQQQHPHAPSSHDAPGAAAGGTGEPRKRSLFAQRARMQKQGLLGSHKSPLPTTSEPVSSLSSASNPSSDSPRSVPTTVAASSDRNAHVSDPAAKNTDSLVVERSGHTVDTTKRQPIFSHAGQFLPSLPTQWIMPSELESSSETESDSDSDGESGSESESVVAESTAEEQMTRIAAEEDVATTTERNEEAPSLTTPSSSRTHSRTHSRTSSRSHSRTRGWAQLTKKEYPTFLEIAGPAAERPAPTAGVLKRGRRASVARVNFAVEPSLKEIGADMDVEQRQAEVAQWRAQQAAEASEEAETKADKDEDTQSKVSKGGSPPASSPSSSSDAHAQSQDTSTTSLEFDTPDEPKKSKKQEKEELHRFFELSQPSTHVQAVLTLRGSDAKIEPIPVPGGVTVSRYMAVQRKKADKRTEKKAEQEQEEETALKGGVGGASTGAKDKEAPDAMERFRRNQKQILSFWGQASPFLNDDDDDDDDESYDWEEEEFFSDDEQEENEDGEAAIGVDATKSTREIASKGSLESRDVNKSKNPHDDDDTDESEDDVEDDEDEEDYECTPLSALFPSHEPKGPIPLTTNVTPMRLAGITSFGLLWDSVTSLHTSHVLQYLLHKRYYPFHEILSRSENTEKDAAAAEKNPMDTVIIGRKDILSSLLNSAVAWFDALPTPSGLAEETTNSSCGANNNANKKTKSKDDKSSTPPVPPFPFLPTRPSVRMHIEKLTRTVSLQRPLPLLLPEENLVFVFVLLLALHVLQTLPPASEAIQQALEQFLSQETIDYDLPKPLQLWYTDCAQKMQSFLLDLEKDHMYISTFLTHLPQYSKLPLPKLTHSARDRKSVV